MNYYYLILGLLPGIIWLLYFVRKDKNPEPRKHILETFVLGMLVTLPALFWELAAEKYLVKPFFELQSAGYILMYFFVVVSLGEELFKLAAVQVHMANHKEFDEPMDSMVYLISAAMGFATMENLLTNFGVINSGNIFANEFVVFDTIMRFLGPTLLHALCSAIVGYFYALETFKYKKFSLTLGLALAIFVHGAFDVLAYGLKMTNDVSYFLAMLAILALSIFLVSKILFRHFKKEQLQNKRQPCR